MKLTIEKIAITRKCEKYYQNAKNCEKLEKYQKQKNIGRRREVGENPMAAHLQGKTQVRYPNPNTTENRTMQPLTPFYCYWRDGKDFCSYVTLQKVV